MGGSSYDRDVHASQSSTGFSSGQTSSSYAKDEMSRDTSDPETSPSNRVVTSKSKSPVVVLIDDTGSNIEFARIIYDKAPMLYGQIEQKKYLDDFEICFSLFGDAHSDTEAPLQVAEFAKGIELDGWLKKLYLVEQGGGQEMETSELAAYYFAHFCSMPKATQPFLFLVTDEKPYPELTSDIVAEYLGRDIRKEIPVEKVFADLFAAFKGNVYVLLNPYSGLRDHTGHPQKIFHREWVETVGTKYAEHVIPIRDEKSFVDVILGIIALVSRTRNLGGYLQDMTDRGQTQKRITNVSSTLDPLSRALVPVVDEKKLSTTTPTKQRSSGSKRV